MHGIWFGLRAKAIGVVRLINGKNPFTDSVSIQSIIIKDNFQSGLHWITTYWRTPDNLVKLLFFEEITF